MVVIDLEDGTDIGVMQCRRLSFDQQPAAELVVVARKEYERDHAAKLGVLSLVDHTPSALAELLEDPVVEPWSPTRKGMIGHCEGERERART